MPGQGYSSPLFTLLVQGIHPENQPAVTEHIFYLAPVPPPHQDRREYTERRAQCTSGNARHCDRSKIRAVRCKMNHRAAPGNVERTGDQGTLGNKQRTPIDRNRAGNAGIVRYLDDSSEFVTDYSLDHIP